MVRRQPKIRKHVVSAQHGYTAIYEQLLEGGYQVMHLKANPESAPDGHRGRYEFLEKFGFGE